MKISTGALDSVVYLLAAEDLCEGSVYDTENINLSKKTGLIWANKI